MPVAHIVNKLHKINEIVIIIVCNLHIIIG